MSEYGDGGGTQEHSGVRREAPAKRGEGCGRLSARVEAGVVAGTAALKKGEVRSGGGGEAGNSDAGVRCRFAAGSSLKKRATSALLLSRRPLGARK